MLCYNFNAGKAQLFSFDHLKNPSIIDVKIDGLFLIKTVYGLSLTWKLDKMFYNVSLAKSASRKFES